MAQWDPRNQAATKSVDTSVIDAARSDSRDCPFCDGEGMITVYAPLYKGEVFVVTPDGRKYVARTTAHCRCRLGRYMRAQTKEEIRRSIPDVEDIATGRSRWLVVSPIEKPLVDSSSPVDEASWRKWWRRVRVSRIAKPIP